MTQKNSHRRGSRLRPLKMNITLKGDRGKPLRIAVLVIAAIVVLVLAANIFRPKVQLQSTPEYNRIQELGVLTVGVLDGPDFPITEKASRSSLQSALLNTCFPTPRATLRLSLSP